MNGNSGLALRSAGLHPTQCTYCQLDPYTGEHICNCLTQGYLVGAGYASDQQILTSAANCDCPQCPYQIYVGGGPGLLNGGFQLAGGIPMNPAFGMGGFQQMNPFALQGMSPFGAAGIGGAGAFGMLSQGFGANRQRMLGYPMIGGMNRRGFDRGVVNKLGYPSIHGARSGRGLFP